MLGVDATGEEVKRMVERVCAMATREYMGIRERPSVLPGSVAWMEEAGARMWRYVGDLGFRSRGIADLKKGEAANKHRT